MISLPVASQITWFMIGFSSCYSQYTCISNSSWKGDLQYYAKVTISRRRATIVYSRGNNTILEVSNLSVPEPTSYTPNDFFPIYDTAMSTNTSDTTGNDYIWFVAGQAGVDDPYDGQMLLRQFIAVPMGTFNDVF
jgi:hypothetical protein